VFDRFPRAGIPSLNGVEFVCALHAYGREATHIRRSRAAYDESAPLVAQSESHECTFAFRHAAHSGMSPAVHPIGDR
jgi:hypothetical protein